MGKAINPIIKTAVIVLLCGVITGCRTGSPEKPVKKNLRIGTVHRAASRNIFTDEALSLFSIISHPPLLKLHADGIISGLLAEDFHYTPDYRVWVFRLKKNLYWSDGRPVSSTDVQFTLLFKGRHNPSRRWLQKAIREIRTPDPGEIRVIFNVPYTRFDIEMASIRIFPRHIWENQDNPQNVESTISFTGCGPFVIQDVELFSGVIRFVRNRFWKGKQPWLDSFEVQMYHNPDIMVMALKRGDVDCTYKYADTIPHVYLPGIKKDERFKILTFPQSGLVVLGFNLRKHPLDNPDMRRAIRWALNYREMLKLAAGGFGEIPTAGFIPSHFPDFQTSEILIQDKNRASSILDILGYRDSNGDGKREDRKGKVLSLTLVTTPLYIRLAELIKDYLEQVGIDIHIQVLDPATWTTVKDNYRYDLTITRTTPWGMMMHAGWASGYFDFRRTGEGVLHTIDDPEYTKLCDRMLATKHPSLLADFARKIQQYYARKIPGVALVWKTDQVVINSNIIGWHYDPLFGIYNMDTFLNVHVNHERH